MKKQFENVVTRKPGPLFAIVIGCALATAGLQVNALSDTLSHIMISSAHSGSQQNAANTILERILKLCADMNVQCSRAQ